VARRKRLKTRRGKAHVEEMIGYHALFEDFQRDGVVPASWATYRATAALHRVVSALGHPFLVIQFSSW
jgi:hypothetical protein